MFDFYERQKQRDKLSRKMEDVRRRTPEMPEEPARPDLPPLAPTGVLRVSRHNRRRLAVGLGSLIAVALVVVVASSGSKAWHYASAQLRLAKLIGVEPVASHVLPQSQSGYPKTAAGFVSYVHDLVTNIQDIFKPSLRIAGEAKTLAGILPQALAGSHGEDLVASLKRLRDAFADLNAHTGVGQQSASAGFIASQGFDFLQGQTSDAQQLIEQAVQWLDVQKPHHVAVLFGNTAEMRPGGGFVGSYADVTIERGAVTDVSVHDITDVDRTLDPNIVPPLALQPLVKRWRAADANWFFNFPDSAQKTLELMNRSHLYMDRKVQLDGVIALSPAVTANILQMTGPITLKDGTKITSENFLKEIQTDVQAGHDSGSDHPKAVLAELVPVIMQRLTAVDTNGASNTDGSKGSPTANSLQLLGILYGALQDKSAVAYFADTSFENVIDRYGWSGRLYDLPRNFTGDYMGITMANVGGAKTDIVIKNTIAVHEHILPSGLLETTVDITRRHNGDKEKDWWYKAEWEGYMKVYTPLGTNILTANGMWDRQYAGRTFGSDYVKDALVASIEKTTIAVPQVAGLFSSTESARSVLGFWQHFSAGDTSTAELDYVRPLPDPVLPGAKYTFVVEKQPAASAHYDVEVTAPTGYTWKESGSNTFSYSTDDLPGRWVMVLTLQRAGE